MDFMTLEKRYLTYYKFLDGIDFSKYIASIGCDLSYNGGITASYLINKVGFSSIYVPGSNNFKLASIVEMNTSKGLMNALSKLQLDCVISVGGTFNFLPIDGVVCSIYNALKVTGQFIIGIYPEIFNEDGENIYILYEDIFKINMYKKLLKWQDFVERNFKRCFPNIKSNCLLVDTTSEEIKDFFKTNQFSLFLFKNIQELDLFFSKLGDNKRLYMSWSIMTGSKI